MRHRRNSSLRQQVTRARRVFHLAIRVVVGRAFVTVVVVVVAVAAASGVVVGGQKLHTMRKKRRAHIVLLITRLAEVSLLLATANKKHRSL